MRRLLRRLRDHVQAQPAAPIARERERFNLAASGQADPDALDAWWPCPAAIPAADRADKLIVQLAESVYVVREAEATGERSIARLGWVFMPLHAPTLSRGDREVKA